MTSLAPVRDLGLLVADGLDPRGHPYGESPADWIHEELGEYTWSRQREVLDSLVERRFTSVRSAHSTGKSHIASRAVAWWASVHDPADTFIVTTAPSANQVEGILWRYINAVHERYGLLGRITMGPVPAWKVGATLIGWGRKPQDLSNAEQAATVFQGIHARNLLIVVDEAGGIPEWLWNAINTLVSDEGGRGRVLAIGNPDDPSSHFAKINLPGSKWHHIKISAFDSPNFIGDPRYTGTPEMAAADIDLPDNVKEMLVGPTFVADAEHDWGEESPLYISKVLAEFPEFSDDNLIQVGWIRAAVERDLSGAAINDLGQAVLDVARTGKDEAVLGWDRGGHYRIVKAKVGINNTMRLVGWLKRFNHTHPAPYIIIDADGMGGPVYDRAAELGLPVTPFYAGRRALNPKKFVNRRSEQWWGLRLLFQEGLIDIDPLDLKLQAQLSSIKFEEDSAGRIKVESKKEMKRRGFPSPDRADTLMMVKAPADDWLADSDERPLSRTHTADLLKEDIW